MPINALPDPIEFILLFQDRPLNLIQYLLGRFNEINGCFLTLTGELNHALQRGHPHAEEFIEIVGENAEKADPVLQWNGRIIGFLQYTSIEAQPTDVAG